MVGLDLQLQVPGPELQGAGADRAQVEERIVRSKASIGPVVDVGVGVRKDYTPPESIAALDVERVEAEDHTDDAEEDENSVDRTQVGEVGVVPVPSPRSTGVEEAGRHVEEAEAGVDVDVEAEEGHRPHV